MKHFYFFLLALFLATVTYAQPPAGYYSSVEGLNGEALKAELNNIIDAHTEYSYSAVWDILKDTDKDPNNSNNVIGFYSRFSMNAAAQYDGAQGWNREHVWAKSRGDFGTTMGAGTDVHHIRAADVSTNSARNNRAFDNGGTVYVDGSGNYSGTTPCKKGSAWTWEPGDDQKGDVARMCFYMATRYEGENGEVDLELTEQILGNTDKQPLHGVLSTLLAWHAADPVDTEEMQRNNIIYSYQNNRNPYIDHPEYVDLIWGSGSGVASGGSGGSGSGSSAIIISEYVEGSSYNKAIELANVGSESIDLSTISLKKQTNGAGSWSTALNLSGTLAVGDVYVVANSNAGSSLTSLADLTSTSSVMTFNGNDPVGLFVNDVLVDVVGTFDGGSSNFAKDVVLRRLPDFIAGNTTYATAEWDVLGQSDFSDVGSHTFNGGSGGSGGSGTGEVLISEYVEGSSYNKAIEITNYTANSINLSEYTLKRQTNGSGSWSSGYTMTGTLAPGDVHVVANQSAGSTLLALADETTGNSALTFNGNDPVGLFHNGTLIDIVGTFDGGSGNFAKDVTLRRDAAIELANTTYTLAEWAQLAKDDFSNVGVNNGQQSRFASNDNPLISTEEKVIVYQNAQGALVAQSKMEENASFHVFVYNINGQQVFSSKLSLESNGNVELTNQVQWPAGLYLVHFYGNENQIQKLVIR